ncbi:hypothetical protein OKIT_1516 [Oenococcus kitaharae DSM 17330]|uniref:Uncharacterized protein n=1 Tax=Oenococcus kitaharae DSM 17330 TaxID=1045004 RepID=G9WG19_9LACO|nr:hypothetical protein OKIT_1516 [Oenococcus kitaharae DSM 17330]
MVFIQLGPNLNSFDSNAMDYHAQNTKKRVRFTWILNQIRLCFNLSIKYLYNLLKTKN